jgi:hypothetical protein
VSGTLLLTDVRPFGGPSRDLPVVDGRIARVGERLDAPEGAAVVAGRGHLAVPGLIPLSLPAPPGPAPGTAATASPRWSSWPGRRRRWCSWPAGSREG